MEISLIWLSVRLTERIIKASDRPESEETSRVSTPNSAMLVMSAAGSTWPSPMSSTEPEGVVMPSWLVSSSTYSAEPNKLRI